MRRLSTQIYLTIVAGLVLVVVLTGTFWRIGADNPQIRQAFQVAGELAAAALPPADAPLSAQREGVARLAERLRTDIALVARDGSIIAMSGREMPHPDRAARGRWLNGPGGPSVVVPLPEGRRLVMRLRGGPPMGAVGLALLLAAVAAAVGLAAYPVVRGLTGRLERLQRGVEKLGQGDLTTRVKVEGRDEVAGLAAALNRSAERIEGLVTAHRLLLANTSHELRTPLARIRLGIELAKKGLDEGRKAELERDIAELDQLLEEILLSSRLDAIRTLERTERVDLLGLAAEESSRHEGVAVGGEVVWADGDPRLLRRLLRNLLDNARHHGAPPISVSVGRSGATAVIDVADAGTPIAAEDRERVFAAFYRRPGSTAPGTGLGLSLVRQIARLHGGDTVLVAEDAGNRFRVTLPESAAAPGS